jgi:hypothetical protein
MQQTSQSNDVSNIVDQTFQIFHQHFPLYTFNKNNNNDLLANPFSLAAKNEEIDYRKSFV